MVPVASVGTNGSKQPRRVRLEALGYGRGALYVSNPGDKDRQRFIHVFSIDGVQCEQRLQARTITQARAEAGKRATKKDEGELVTPSTSTFADVAEEFLAMQTSLVDSGERSPRTIALYRQRFTSHLSSPLGKKRFQHLTTRDVAALLATMRAGGLSPNTMAGVLMLTGSIFRFGVARGYRADNPVERLHRSERPRAKARTQPRTLTDEQCGLLIRNARDSVRDLIAFLAFTGTRQSEALGVTWGELDLEQGSVSINAQLGRLTPTRVPLKTANSRRRIDLHPTLVTMLKERKKLAFAKGLPPRRPARVHDRRREAARASQRCSRCRARRIRGRPLPGRGGADRLPRSPPRRERLPLPLARTRAREGGQTPVATLERA